MQVELHCDRCGLLFHARLGASAEQALDLIHRDGPWTALGDGETVEDHLSAAFSGPAAPDCPDCGEPATLSEASLGQLSLELLGQW